MSAFTERVAKSRADRAAMLAKFGIIPTSILRLARGKASARMFTYQKEERGRSIGMRYDGTQTREVVTDRAKESDRERAKLKMLGGGLETKKSGSRVQASIMPAELVAFFAKYYAKPGDTYLDPFIGQGVQMQVAHELGMHYIGMDASRTFMAYVERTRDRIDDHTTTIDVRLGDSRHPTHIPDHTGDFMFTSPPYWDVEYYGDEPEQLGTNHTYDEFMTGITDVMRAWHPKMKPGAYAIINTNDIRKDGRFIPYHADYIRATTNAGWTMHDMWIIDGLVGGLPKAFGVAFNLKRIAPKVHEYALVFRA
jgi:hypothetical protein